MRILFDSKKLIYKDPFGCLVPQQTCRLHIHIPATVETSAVSCVFQKENGAPYMQTELTLLEQRGMYQVWAGEFFLKDTGLYFYYFRITGKTGTFRLFKQGDDTNMEAGDLWQISCVPADFTTPDWAKGAVIYQVFPDRFHKTGSCDLTGKLEPYEIHERISDQYIEARLSSS